MENLLTIKDIVCLILVLSLTSICYAGLLDPTRPPWFKGEGSHHTEGWAVKSVIIAPARRLAVVNGRTVKVGDRIGGAQIVAISRKGVTFQGSKGEFTIHLLKKNVKRTKGEMIGRTNTQKQG